MGLETHVFWKLLIILLFTSVNDFITGRSLALPTCQFCYWLNYHQPTMLKIWLAWFWWPHVWPLLPWLCIIWLVHLSSECHECEFCMWPFKITELEKRRWSWISNCGEAFHTDSWLAEANSGHSDPDVILQALLPGSSTVVLLAPAKWGCAAVGHCHDKVSLNCFPPTVASCVQWLQLETFDQCGTFHLVLWGDLKKVTSLTIKLDHEHWDQPQQPWNCQKCHTMF